MDDVFIGKIDERLNVKVKNQILQDVPLIHLDGVVVLGRATISPAAIAKVSSSYFVMNAKVEADIWKNRLGIFAEADNVFDKDFADLLGAQMPGRWLMGGIKISLSK